MTIDRMRWAVSGMLLTAVCLAATLPGCLRAAHDRAERDREVGHASAAGIAVDVDQGHAAVFAIEPDRLVLWGSVPAFELRLEREVASDQPLEIEVRNLMPGAELTRQAGVEVEVAEPERLLETRSRWSVRWPEAGEVRLRVGPLDADEPEAFQFALLNDVQEAIDDFHEMVARVNQEPDVSFVLGAGDLTENGSAAELRRFQDELEALKVPYYATLGNHELGVDPPAYHGLFGRGNYSFNYRQVRFTLLDSASAMLDPLVYDWLETWLAAGALQTHVVAMHIPPLDPSGTRHGAFASKNEAAKLLNRLALAGVDLTLYGHIHTYLRFENAGIEAHIAGGGGAIPNRGDGIGRHYLLVRLSADADVQHTRVVEVDSDWDF